MGDLRLDGGARPRGRAARGAPPADLADLPPSTYQTHLAIALLGVQHGIQSHHGSFMVPRE